MLDTHDEYFSRLENDIKIKGIVSISLAIYAKVIPIFYGSGTVLFAYTVKQIKRPDALIAAGHPLFEKSGYL